MVFRHSACVFVDICRMLSHPLPRGGRGCREIPGAAYYPRGRYTC